MDAATLRLAIPSLKVLQQRVSAHVTCYTRPIELSSFSYDGNRKLHLDRSELVKYPLSHILYRLVIIEKISASFQLFRVCKFEGWF